MGSFVMMLHDAIKSGRRFRRQSWDRTSPAALVCNGWFQNNSLSDWTCFKHADVLADDWEIEEKKVEITLEIYRSAVKRVAPYLHDGIIFQDLAKEFGLE